MKICFIGHRKIENLLNVRLLLKETVLALIKKGADVFLFGSMSEFDGLAWEVVTEFKKDFPYIKRVYVRSAYKNINKFYEDFLLKSYEETYFPANIENAGKYSYVERNYDMINNSTYCVFYYNKNYMPNIKRNSGTKIAYEYAKKKKKEIINLYDLLFI